MRKKGVVRCKTKTNMGEGEVVSLVIIFLPWGKKRKEETYVDWKWLVPMFVSFSNRPFSMVPHMHEKSIEFIFRI